MHSFNLIIVQNGGTVNFNGQATAAIIEDVPGPEPARVPELVKITDHKLFAHKIQIALADYYRATFRKDKAANIAACGSFLAFQSWLDPENTSMLTAANFCKHPLCPMCAWRRSLQWTSRAAVAAQKIAALPGRYLYHLTLTIINTETISRDQLRQLKLDAKQLIKNYYGCNDYLLSLEIKYNDKTMYHPHIHALLASTHPLPHGGPDIRALRRVWAKQRQETRQPWLEAALYPVTDTGKAAAEIGKYIVKYETQDLPRHVVHDLAAALHGQRKIQPSGLWRTELSQAKLQLENNKSKELQRLAPYPSWEEFYSWSSEGFYRCTDMRQDQDGPPPAGQA